MSEREIKNIAASVRDRLLRLSRISGENYNAILLRFFQERFLVRLGVSQFQKHFVLKGGLLLIAGQASPFRPTVDIDMLGVAISSDPDKLITIIREIAETDLNDGVRFNAEDISYRVIKVEGEYQGVRFTLGASLGKIHSNIQPDIGFGDIVPLKFKKQKFPMLISDLPDSEIYVYPLESVIAEKFQAIVYLGFATSRMKDFYDIFYLSGHNRFTLKSLKEAIISTFSQRKTKLENRFFIYEKNYLEEKDKLWKAFLIKIDSNMSRDFPSIIEHIKIFLEPVISAGDKEGILIWDADQRKWH